MFEDGPAGGAAARRERGRREMRAAIIEAARRIINEQGADALTIRSVAGALGYSPGALYEYFASKEDILIAIYFESQHGMDAICAQAVRDLPEDTGPAETLRALGEAYRRHALAHAELYLMSFGAFKSPPVLAANAPERNHPGAFDTIVEVAEAGVREGVFIEIDPLEIAYMAWSSVHGFVSLELTGRMGNGQAGEPEAAGGIPDRQRRDALFGTYLRVFTDGLSRR